MTPDNFTGSRGPVEPSADMRTMAKALREMYLALIAERFTERQALAILGEAIKIAGQQ
jgi:hypothetical protein